MKALIIGAAGGIGRLVAAADRQDLRAMVRDPSRAPAFAPGTEVVTGDLEGDFAPLLDGCDRVVFTAGSGGHTGPDKTLLVDLWGAVRAIDQARQVGVRHFIMVSALRSHDPLRAPEKLRPYMVAKRMADLYLQNSGVPWTILLPGRLTDQPGSGRLSPTSAGLEISRQNVARAILYLLDHPPLGRALQMVDGETPLERFLQSGGDPYP